MNGIEGNQFIVVNLNGISYLSQIKNLEESQTMEFGSANPNSPNNIVITVEYTASQWDAVSHAPSLWTDPLGTIEYYWYISLGVLLGAIGLGSGLGNKALQAKLGGK
jgi:hypothetical protein